MSRKGRKKKQDTVKPNRDQGYFEKSNITRNKWMNEYLDPVDLDKIEAAEKDKK
jgi:hypothetical protein